MNSQKWYAKKKTSRATKQWTSYAQLFPSCVYESIRSICACVEWERPRQVASSCYLLFSFSGYFMAHFQGFSLRMFGTFQPVFTSHPLHTDNIQCVYCVYCGRLQLSEIHFYRLMDIKWTLSHTATVIFSLGNWKHHKIEHESTHFKVTNVQIEIHFDLMPSSHHEIFSFHHHLHPNFTNSSNVDSWFIVTFLYVCE